MAIPVVASVGTVVTGNGSSIATTAPSGVASGDLLVLCVTLQNALVGTITTPTGWTQSDTQADAIVRASMFYRIATGGADDTPTVACSSQDYAAVILRITGAATSTPQDAELGAHNTTVGNFNLPTITTTQNNDLCIAMACCTNGMTDPSTWTNKASGTNNGNHIAVWSKDAATAGSFGGESVGTGGAASYATITSSFKEGAALSDVGQMMEAISQQRHNRRRGVRGIAF